MHREKRIIIRKQTICTRRKMMKLKKVLVVALAATTVVSMAACASGKKEEKAEGTKSEKLTVAIWDSNQEAGLRTIMDGFTEETGIEVDIQVTPWKDYWTMLEAATTGGSMPDVFWMHSHQIRTYAEYDDILLDLSDKIKESDKISLENYPEDIVNIYQNDDGKQLAVPKDIDTCALWYNKTMFDEAGAPYPQAGWTWDDFRETAKKLTKADGSQYGFSMKPGSDQESWYSTIYAYGGEVINKDKTKSGFDNPKTLEAMNVIDSIIKDGSMPEYNVVAENDTVALLEAGTVAMTFQGSWMVPELVNNDFIKANCDIAPLPQGPEGTKSMYNGLGWAASAQGKNTEGAWQLIEYLGSEEMQKKQAELGVTMSAYKGTSDAWVESHPEFNLKAHLDMMDDAVIYPSSKNTQAWYQMMLDKMVDAWNGTKPMEDVCKDVATEMNKMLDEERQ